MRVRFEDYCFDGERRELRRGSRIVPLSPRALELLTLLLEHRPRPQPHRALKDVLWPDTAVGYTSLARVVGEVRQAIGDTTRPFRLVRTVSRVGYAFTAPAVGEAGPALGHCAFVSRDHEFHLPEGVALVGRGDECGVKLPSSEVSRVHERVHAAPGSVTLDDMGSKNGTWVNGFRRKGATVLADGDEVVFGTFRVVFRRSASAGSTRTALPPGGPA